MIARARILVVESHHIIAKDIEKILERFGYAVSAIASSGEDAVRQVEEDKPDLVLTEVLLDGKMDGIEAAAQISSRFNVPIIFLTAVSDKKTIERAKLTEPYGYVVKPFEEESLHASLEMALHKHRVHTNKSGRGANLSTAKENNGTKTSALGLREDWTRATFIVKKEHLEKIKAVAYWDRRKVKDIIEDALETYLKNREVVSVSKSKGD